MMSDYLRGSNFFREHIPDIQIIREQQIEYDADAVANIDPIQYFLLTSRRRRHRYVDENSYAETIHMYEIIIASYSTTTTTHHVLKGATDGMNADADVARTSKEATERNFMIAVGEGGLE